MLDQPLRWDLILERIKFHEIFPLVCRNLRMLNCHGVPPLMRVELESLFRMNGHRNTMLAGELAEILRLLDAVGVPAIPLKGIPLSESLYGDISLRVCADIDILVPRSLLPQSFGAVRRRGYTTDFAPPGVPLERLTKNSIECFMLRADGSMTYLLEPHWGILTGGSLEERAVSDLWVEAQRAVFFGVPAYRLSPEWEFLFLAAHAARHEWGKLKWLADLHEICSQRQIDWEKVAKQARLLGWSKLVRLTLAACRGLLGTQIPPNFALAMFPPPVTTLPAGSPASWPFHTTFHLLGLLEGTTRKLRFLIERFLVPTTAEYQLVQLPSAAHFLYYLLRPLRLVIRLNLWLLSTGVESVRRFWKRLTSVCFALAGCCKIPFVRSLTVAARKGLADVATLTEPRALASGPVHQFFNNLLVSNPRRVSR